MKCCICHILVMKQFNEPARVSIMFLMHNQDKTSNHIQGQRKLFISGQGKLYPEHYSVKCVGG